MSKMKHKEKCIKWKNADFYLVLYTCFCRNCSFSVYEILSEWKISCMEP